jgi:hypothetical protein
MHSVALVRSSRFVFAALVAVTCSACTQGVQAAAGPSVDTRTVARSITLCRTTEAELRRQLGEPTRDGLLRRDRVVSWIVEENQVVKYLAVLLNSGGVVTDLYWDLPTEIPWVPVSQCS